MTGLTQPLQQRDFLPAAARHVTFLLLIFHPASEKIGNKKMDITTLPKAKTALCFSRAVFFFFPDFNSSGCKRVSFVIEASVIIKNKNQLAALLYKGKASL